MSRVSLNKKILGISLLASAPSLIQSPLVPTGTEPCIRYHDIVPVPVMHSCKHHVSHSIVLLNVQVGYAHTIVVPVANWAVLFACSLTCYLHISFKFYYYMDTSLDSPLEQARPLL
jgi:hypothetical protein